ncbi:unnamed protein product [Paramecium pentaurelia]|uniref:Uncharacterized protein n=1 Tax=Paramecium pentaurelia TaxID=43138 RepID=A0A8S1V2A2_9CILI|nr:unnamed protein product [Paramecium pentaurelia]
MLIFSSKLRKLMNLQFTKVELLKAFQNSSVYLHKSDKIIEENLIKQMQLFQIQIEKENLMMYKRADIASITQAINYLNESNPIQSLNIQVETLKKRIRKIQSSQKN